MNPVSSTWQLLKGMVNVYEYDADDCTRKWTGGQWLCLICGFTGTGLYLLNSPLARLTGFLSVDALSKLGVVLMIAGFGFFTSARSGLLLAKFDRRTRKRTEQEMLPGEWEHDGLTHEVAGGSPSPP